MKSGIHPQWNHDAVVKCGCGNTFETGSSRKELTVDVCSACHPFYTGEMKFVDTQGRVERFMNKRAASQTYVKKDKKSEKQQAEVLSLKDLMAATKKSAAKSE